MTGVEKHIRHFNLMNGNVIRKDTLEKFLRDLPEDPRLDEVRLKLKKMLQGIGNDVDATFKFKPLPYPVVNLNGTKELIHGLQCIQNDKHLESKSLDGINDTTYKVITDRILELISAGGLIWRKPWNDRVNGPTDLAHNHVTKHIYKGGNYYLNFLRFGLKVGGKLIQYNAPQFFTFKQVEKLGGRVIKGEKGWPVIYFKWLYKDIKRNRLVEPEEAISGGRLKPGYEKIPGLFYYNVFNLEQCEGLKINIKAAKKRTEREIIESAENIIEMMPKPPKIRIEGNEAWYNRSIDTVQVPPMSQFKIDQHFYSTQFHELIHSTGHQDRVYREREASRRFGDKNYAFEELIAELGASFLCGHSGILYYTMKESAAYIQNWSTKLKQEMQADPKFFLRAASQAQKAADFILAEGEYEHLKVKKKKPKANTTRAAVRRSAAKKAKPMSEKKSVPVEQGVLSGTGNRSGKKPGTALSGFTTADQAPEEIKTERLQGEIGEFLQDIQRYKLLIVVAGETHSSKSELGKQIADGFLSAGHTGAWIDWEQGGLQSKDTLASIHRNIKPENRKRLYVTGNLPKNLDAVKALSKDFDFVVLDSGNSLKFNTNTWMDELREEYPETVWIILMQQNTKGSTRGGSSAEFDTPVGIYTYRPDETDFRMNYAKLFKNRGNKTGLHYNIAAKKIFKPTAS